MVHIPDDRFRVFVSHKHEDHALADTVKEALEGLSSTIECFVSGTDIGAATDWNLEIRQELARSHLLVLVFTNPSQNWDWCLYEAGLFTRFEADEVCAVVSLFHPGGSPPRPLSNLQGVPADNKRVEAFLSRLCHETWRVSDDWLRGPLAPGVEPPQIEASAARIVGAFQAALSSDDVHHPCHRVVLDLRHLPSVMSGIPDDARVIDGRDATSEYTLSLFRAAGGRRTRTWGELVAAVAEEDWDTAWRDQLDRRFAAALRGELFPPTTTTLRAFDPERQQRRYYRPILYEVVRSGPTFDGVGAGSEDRRPIQLTVVFDPQPAPSQGGGTALNLLRTSARFATEVFGVFCGNVAHRSGSGSAVFSEIQEAFDAIYQEADRCRVFDLNEIERAYGEGFEPSGVRGLGVEWDARRELLCASLAAQDVGAVENVLADMRELNRGYSLTVARRYLKSLEERHDQAVEPGLLLT